MAGFFKKVQNSWKHNNLSGFLKDLSRFGISHDEKVIKNSRAIGYVENELSTRGFLYPDDDYAMFLNMSMNDIKMRKNVAFFNKEYTKRREELRDISLQDEIEDILDTLCDEAIVYDERNFLAHPAPIDIPDYKKEKLEELRDNVNEIYKKIYRYWGFNDDTSAWSFFKKWLIDGFLAFEIIYDGDPKKGNQQNIIGFKELDPISLQQAVDDKGRMIWIQYKGDVNKERRLYDSQIIYLSYSSLNSPSRVSYVERLIRPYNVLRLMEHTRVIWAVVNATWRTKFIIPVGGKSKNRAKESLQKLMSDYKENIEFDPNSATIDVNGKPNLPFNKEYWLPSKDGESPQIDTIKNDGPELSDTRSLVYFYNKLKMVSKIPFNRFEKDGASQLQLGAEGISREEQKFARFISRLRSTFQEILVKPLWIQLTMDKPELAEDQLLRSKITIRYNNYTHYDEMAEMETLERKFQFVSSMQQFFEESPDPMQPPQEFPNDWLIKRFLKFNHDDIDDIKSAKKQRDKELEKKRKEQKKREQEEMGGGFDVGGFDAGGFDAPSMPQTQQQPQPQPDQTSPEEKESGETSAIDDENL